MMIDRQSRDRLGSAPAIEINQRPQTDARIACELARARSRMEAMSEITIKLDQRLLAARLACARGFPGNEWEGEGLPPPRVEKSRGGMLPYSFSKISRWYYNTSRNCRRVFQKSEWCTQALALALLVPGAGGDVIIDGDTIDIDGVRNPARPDRHAGDIRAALQERPD